MTASTLEAIQQDGLAMSVAHALAIANQTANAQGTDPSQCLVTIEEEPAAPHSVWRVHYGPRDYRNRRGGDLIVLVDERAGAVQRIIRGQ
jgi:hypothetical protein